MNNEENGIVLKSTGSWYKVRVASGMHISCKIKGKFRMKGLRTTNPIAVGDRVIVEIQENGTGVIKEIKPRNNYIIRKSVNLSKEAHIIASNIDQAVLLVTLKEPLTSAGFIDRFLVSAEAYRIPVILVFNKMDTYTEEEIVKVNCLAEIYQNAGYEILKFSAIKKEGVDLVRKLLKDKKTLLSGHSGVGKSTMVNTIDNNLNLKTNKISLYHGKGQHTTTFAEMFELSFGGYVIDTPGIKGFGLVDLKKEEIAHFFPEMRKLMNKCKFNNCSHINEPGCAVKEALKDNLISNTRYKSYLQIYNEDTAQNYR